MALCREGPRVLHTRISKLFEPDTFPCNIAYSPKLIKLENHIRSITSPETFWSIKKPIVNDFDVDSSLTTKMLATPLQPLRRGDEPSVPDSEASSTQDFPDKETRMTMSIVKIEETAPPPWSWMIAPATTSQISSALNQPVGSERTLDEFSLEQLIAYLNSIPFAKAVILEKLAKEPLGVMPQPAPSAMEKAREQPSPLPADKPNQGIKASSTVATPDFEVEVQVRVAQAKRELRKTMEREHQNTVNRMKETFKAKLEEAIRKQKEALEKSVWVPEGRVWVKTAKHGPIVITNQEATRLLCQNSVVGKTFRELCLQALHKYKERVRDEYKKKTLFLMSSPNVPQHEKKRLHKVMYQLPPTPSVSLDPWRFLEENSNSNVLVENNGANELAGNHLRSVFAAAGGTEKNKKKWKNSSGVYVGINMGKENEILMEADGREPKRIRLGGRKLEPRTNQVQ